MDAFAVWTSTLAGFVFFGVAVFAHRKRLTRFACVLAAIAGFMTYAAAIGTAINDFAARFPVLLVAGVAVGLIVIVVDIRGKRKGADKPALFAFYLVPIFLVAFITSLPKVLADAGDGLRKTGEQITSQMEH